MAMKTKYRPPEDGMDEERKGDNVPLFDRPRYKREKKSKLSAVGRLISVVLFIVFCLAVLAALALFWIFREDISRDSINRISSRLTQNFSKHATLSADVISFDSQPDNVLAPFGDGLAVLTTNRLVCYDAIGGERISAERYFKRPVMQVSSKNVLAYDRNGTTLLLANRNEFLIDTQWEKPIITARLNNDGWAALVTQGAGYKSVVTVLNPDGDIVLKYSSPYYITDAVLSPDASMLAVACATFEDNWVSGQLRLYDLKLDDPEAIRDKVTVSALGDQMIIELFFRQNDRVAAVTERGASFWDTSGTLLGNVVLDDGVLLDFSVLDSAVALRIARNYGGSGSRLELYDWEGALVRQMALHDDVICQSGGGSYITLVTADRILVYDKKLDIVSDEPNETHVRTVLQCDSGAMFFVYNDTARLYTP